MVLYKNRQTFGYFDHSNRRRVATVTHDEFSQVNIQLPEIDARLSSSVVILEFITVQIIRSYCLLLSLLISVIYELSCVLIVIAAVV